jgi:hypothetical protein
MQQLVKGQEVSLGCGTLILIALIVAFFSSKPNFDLSPAMNKLHESDQKVMNKLNELDQKVQQLDQKIERLDHKLDKLHTPRFEKIDK